MDLPRSPSDTLVLLACKSCRGRGGYGDSAHAAGSYPFIPCGACSGTGWSTRHPDQLTPTQADRLRLQLLPVPPDPDVAYDRQCIMDHIKKSLTGKWIQTVAFCGIEPRSIDLVVGSRNQIIRIHPEFRGNSFHNLTTHFVPEPYIPPAETPPESDSPLLKS